MLARYLFNISRNIPQLCNSVLLSPRVLMMEICDVKSLPYNTAKLLQAENALSGSDCSLLKDKSLKQKEAMQLIN